MFFLYPKAGITINLTRTGEREFCFKPIFLFLLHCTNMISAIISRMGTYVIAALVIVSRVQDFTMSVYIS